MNDTEIVVSIVNASPGAEKFSISATGAWHPTTLIDALNQVIAKVSENQKEAEEGAYAAMPTNKVVYSSSSSGLTGTHDFPSHRHEYP